ncbi:MAG: LysR family transcriptional regulator [Micropepsaceae bacterium]
MKLTGFDLNLFVVFEAIYTERNLTRAAGILNVTQPAVSNALARLRAAFDDPLFARRGGVMAPTPVAQSLIQPVRQALARLRSGLDARVKFDPETAARTFHVAMRDTTAAMLLPPLSRRLTREAPGVMVQVHILDRTEIPMELAAGSLDLAIDIPELQRADLMSAPFIADRYVAVMRKGHPDAGKPMTLDRFTAQRHIAISSRRRGRTLIEAALARAGRQGNTVLRVPTFQMAMDVVRDSDLITTLPSLVARALDVASAELPFPSPAVDLLLYWHRNAESDPGNIWLRGAMQAVIDTLLKAQPSRAGRGKNS